jgi:hypothetical protein
MLMMRETVKSLLWVSGREIKTAAGAEEASPSGLGALIH